MEPKTTETASTNTIETTKPEKSTTAEPAIPRTPSKMDTVRSRIASGREKLTVAIEADRNRMYVFTINSYTK